MSTDVKTLTALLSAHGEDRNLINELVCDFTNMESARAGWEAECEELMRFIDATDTRTTTNDKLPFKNSTTINKISQLYDNYVTAMMEHIMPNRDWISFVGNDSDAMNVEKRTVIESYVRGKVEASKFSAVLERLVGDYAGRGIAINHTRHVNQISTTVEGRPIRQYTGTMSERIDPQDFFYDVTASSLDKARKCIRSTYTMGGLRKEIEESTSPIMTLEQFMQLREDRQTVQNAIGGGYNGKRKHDSLDKAGFGTVVNYINEGVVEVLRFFGDFYDEEKDELLTNYEIVIIDRKMIGRKQPLSTWDGSQNLHVTVYEFRKDSLAPIGPLARVVGLQYKLDKRENFKEDLHDKFLVAPLKKIGDVTEHGTRGATDHEFEVEEGGDVGYLFPPSEVLRGDDQLATTLALMEDLTGAPKESIGQRTPGEKTKFEVQLLDQGQSKRYRRKVKNFEEQLVSPSLQDYLEQGRRHLDGADVIKTFNNTLGTAEFTNITAEDLNGNGDIVARGATIFAEKANTLQTINALMGGAMGQTLMTHTDQKKLLRAIEDLGELDKFDLFTFGIGIQQQSELQRLAAKAQESAAAAGMAQETIGEPTEDTEV